MLLYRLHVVLSLVLFSMHWSQ